MIKKEEEINNKQKELEHLNRITKDLNNVDKMIKNDKRQYYNDYMKDNLTKINNKQPVILQTDLE